MQPIAPFLATLFLAPLAVLAADTKPARTKAPFRVLYSDDTTHTLVCVSPYHQGNIAKALPLEARNIDQATYALITDLKQRGLLDDTLVIWGGEFGCTP